MDNSIAILQDLKTNLEHQFPNGIEKVILFGSVARGTNTTDSDFDVLVLLNSDE